MRVRHSRPRLSPKDLRYQIKIYFKTEAHFQFVAIYFKQIVIFTEIDRDDCVKKFPEQKIIQRKASSRKFLIATSTFPLLQ